MRGSPLSVTVMFLVLAALSCGAAVQDDPEAKYQEFRGRLVELYNAKEYAQVAKLIEENYDRFPDKASSMSYNMALVCMHLEDYDRAIEYLSKAHERGHFFSTYAFGGDLWAPLRAHGKYEAVVAKNLAMNCEGLMTRLSAKMNTATPTLDPRRTHRCRRGLKGRRRNGRMTSWTKIDPHE